MIAVLAACWPVTSGHLNDPGLAGPTPVSARPQERPLCDGAHSSPLATDLEQVRNCWTSVSLPSSASLGHQCLWCEVGHTFAFSWEKDMGRPLGMGCSFCPFTGECPPALSSETLLYLNFAVVWAQWVSKPLSR